MTQRRRPPRGFLLMEILFTLAILAVFMVVCGETILLSHRSETFALRQTALTARVDSAMHRLRQDVWNASALSIDPDGALRLTVDDRPITWSAAPIDHQTLPGEGFELERHDGKDRAYTRGIPAVSFLLKGRTLTVTFHSSGRSEGRLVTFDESLALASAVAGGGQ